MQYLIIGIIALGVFAAILGLLSHNKDGSPDVISNSTPSCATCSGEDSRCEQECMMEAATKPIEYFDDEELDAFSNRPSDSYGDEEAEQFREVLYTMRPTEVKDWCRSLTLRSINLPDQVKDEVLLIVGEG
ncbi:MAG: hypothetical protein SOZ80_01605 [Prevotella sp.]|uniref:hypothetical protein n=1 Tax=Prevotella sp. TaxID=59823 RepID=UPI002A28DA58|nr:hypothetical protein [Prevotella sp.]MDD7317365.1 hypothetical protein [Prevotellaceae bacterium]MDY4019463.1 hypothetical protein [Prevotella sp.]